MTMTKKDYELIAEGLEASRYLIGVSNDTEAMYRNIVSNIASSLKNDNPRFDRVKFYRACGLTSEADTRKAQGI
jgi:hypothetical protein